MTTKILKNYTLGAPFRFPDEHSAVQVNPASLVLQVKSAEQNNVVDRRRGSVFGRGHVADRVLTPKKR
jgi:hypothetical protein